MKVTVITPVFNGAKTIQDCIDSIKMQDYPNIEHIVIDGNSSDDTVSIVKKNNIQYISEADAGIYDAFNKGIRAASGDIIHILNSDDMYAERDIISKVIKHMQERNIDVCHGYSEQINDENKVVNRVGKDLSRKELLSKMKISHPSTFIKKNIYQEYGDYSVGFKIAADHELLLRIWDKAKISFLPLVTTKMRLGGASNSQITLSYKESLAASILHGKPVISAVFKYYLELVKNNLHKRK